MCHIRNRKVIWVQPCGSVQNGLPVRDLDLAKKIPRSSYNTIYKLKGTVTVKCD
jgi:purine-nucleoside phosphorylase